MFQRFMSASGDELFHIYLNDHRTGAVGARRVAERSRASNEGNEFGEYLTLFVDQVCDEIVELDRLRDRCGAPSSHVKFIAARIGAEVGQLKLNGRLVGYSPLSRVLEFEMLRSGVAGKTQLWQTVGLLGSERRETADIDTARLLERARAQAARLEELSKRAASIAFANGVSTATASAESS